MLAAAAGGGFGGHIAVVVAYHMPDVPPEGTAAYSSLVVTALALVAAYLTRAEG